MKKYLSLLTTICVIAMSISVYAATENDYVLTPDEGEVPYPPEITNSQIIVTELPTEESRISIEEAEKSKIWENYGYTKEEFDEFPESLRLAMLYEPEQIGISFDVPTREEVAEWEEKEKSVLRENSSMRSTANEVRNAVGEFIQEKSYTCGPASARNAINGYLWYHYTSKGLSIPSAIYWGDVPSESRLADSDNLQTTTSGTSFGSQWKTVLDYFLPGRGYTLQWGSSGWESDFWTKVKTTLNKSGNYNVIGNLYGTITTANQINSEYSVGSSYAHYI